MQICHGQTVLDFLMHYWTIPNFMLKVHSTRKRQKFYLLLNYMGEYIHLLIKPVLNARALSYLEIHVQLTKIGAVTVNHLKLTRSIGSIHFPGGCWHPLAYHIIIMQFTMVMIGRLLLILHLHNITIQNSAYVDSNSYTDSRITCFVRSIKREHFSIQKKGQRYEECSWEKRCFWHTEIRRFFQDVQKLQEVWKIWHSQKTQENSWE